MPSPMESEVELMRGGHLKADPPTALDKADHSTSGKRLNTSSSSSSSSSFELEDPFQDDDNATYDYTPNNSQYAERHGTEDLSSSALKDELSKDKFASSSLPSEFNDQNDKTSSGDLPPTESPPTQMMDHSDTSSYRIPSSVFVRSKSSNPMGWSINSNESLFSIQMGTMSFTKDALLWQSEELYQLEELSTSDQMFNFTADESSVDVNARKSHDLGVAVETMKSVFSENIEDQNEKHIAEGHLSRQSYESSNSTTSFAFTTLTGEMDKVSSERIAAPVTVGVDQQNPEAKPLSEPHSQPETPKDETSTTPDAKSNQPDGNWLSCLSCFASCH